MAGAPLTHQAEGVVGVHELFHAVLLQHHHVVQVGAPLPRAVLAVDHVRLPAAALAGHKQQVKHLHLRAEEAQEAFSTSVPDWTRSKARARGREATM